jgi:hypothetical protein
MILACLPTSETFFSLQCQFEVAITRAPVQHVALSTATISLRRMYQTFAASFATCICSVDVHQHHYDRTSYIRSCACNEHNPGLSCTPQGTNSDDTSYEVGSYTVTRSTTTARAHGCATFDFVLTEYYSPTLGGMVSLLKEGATLALSSTRSKAGHG